MRPALEAAAWFMAAAFACAVLTRAWIGFARGRRIEDQPGQRRLHAETTPRGGGVAIALVLLSAMAWLAMSGSGSVPWLGLAAGVAMFAGLGLLDDLLPMPAAGKLALQLGAGLVLVAALLPGWGYGWLAAAALVLACAYSVNIWNFMDGSNGLVTVQALLLALALALWPGQPAELRFPAIALAGACAGFLPFNLPRAQVFLGDVGSHTLGAGVFLLLLLSWLAGSLGLLQILLVCNAMLLDSGYTLLRRALAGRRVWRAHREHLYQYAVRKGHSHSTVCLYYAAWTALGIALAAAAGQSRSSFVIWIVFILQWVFGTVVHFGLRRHWLGSRPHRGREA
jgi:UDP-N-acetylmuramyl pentapeptide phosphotransferase/UDP-N-acetylglucosamine-1-phosphate transferase